MVWAHQDRPDSQPQEVVAPVLLKSQNSDDVKVGVITADASGVAQELNALSILRNELNRISSLEQAKAEKDGVFKNVNKRFPSESLTFFIAIGLVTYNSMWIKSHGDPLAMERHILSLKDPIAHLSFYTFMQANGYYMHWGTKKHGLNTMDPATRRQMMTRLSYEGMAIGSIASSIIADLGHSGKMCVDSWIKGKTDELSIASCDQAWAQWTLRNKFVQYFPQIIALWVSQAATTVLETGIFKGFDTVNKTSLMQRLLKNDFLVKSAYKITGADVAMTFASGTWSVKAIRLVGKITKFSMFVGVDHLLSPYIYRPLNSLLKPVFFDDDVKKINDLWLAADKNNWDQSKLSQTAPIETFEKEIENYTNQMQQWREHLNSDAEADIAGWMEMTKKILNQMDYAYKYYRGFAGSVFENNLIQQKIQNKELAPTAANLLNGYPYRTLPFYGVRPGAYKAIGGQLEDFYLLNPNELEMRQKEHVIATAKKYQSSDKVGLRKHEIKILNNIIDKLLTDDHNRIASGLNDLNNISELKQMYVAATGSWEDSSGLSLAFQDLTYKMRKELGNPQPVVYPLAGYSQAFAANSIYQVIAETADFSKWSKSGNYSFNKEADLMLYSMICGPNQAALSRIKLGVDFFNPQFNPPALLNYNSDRSEFCTKRKTTENLYSSAINGKSLQDFLKSDLNYSILDTSPTLTTIKGKATEKPSAFDQWWFKNTKEPMNHEFKKFDKEFQELVKLSYNNFFEIRDLDTSSTKGMFKTYYDMFKTAADRLNFSMHLPRSINDVVKAETRVYIQLLSRTLLKTAPVPHNKNIKSIRYENSNDLSFMNYVEFATRTSKEISFSPLYDGVPKELEKLDQLIAIYPSFLAQESLNFNSYIAHSKKIDTAINDVLVLHGLKKISSAFVETEDLSASAAASGTENSDKVYEDVPVQNLTYKQRVAIAAIRGLRQVEADVRRFIRMKVMLSQSLEVETEEFMKDWDSSNATQSNSSKAKRINPFGSK